MNFRIAIIKKNILHKSCLKYLQKMPKFTWAIIISSLRNSTLSSKIIMNGAIVHKTVGRAYSIPMNIGSNYNKIPMISQLNSMNSIRNKLDHLDSINWISDLSVLIMSSYLILEKRIIHRWEQERKNWEGRRKNQWLLRDWQFSSIMQHFILPFRIQQTGRNHQWEWAKLNNPSKKGVSINSIFAST